MGSLLSVSLSIDNFINPCCACTTSHLNHAFNLENNLRKLSNELDELKEMRNDVRAKIELAERQQMRPLEQVQGWLSRVEAMETEVGKLMQISTQGINRRCCFVCRPRNWISVHKLGKKVSKKQGEIDSLKKKCAFNELVVRFPFTQVDERPSEVTVGMESIFEKVWGHLQEEVVVIGLYGLGGVGKTTLLTQINNKFANTSHNFDVVIWVVVSKDTDIAIIQKKIGEKIGFSGDNWIRKSTDDKSSDIYRVLSRKKFLLLLDDIWKPYDLLKIGVPLRTNQNKSKVVFTTRSEDVCGRMGAQTKVKVECLPWVEAWNLFRQNVGEEPLLCDPKIPVLAQVIAKECGGLPLALITIGRAMSCKKTHQEWLYAIQVLKNFAAEFSVKNVYEFEDNLRRLTISSEKLENLREDVERRTEVAERRPQMKRSATVHGWLSAAAKMKTEVNRLIDFNNAEINNKCCFDCCPGNCGSTWKLAKKVVKKLKEINSLIEDGRFDALVDRLPLPEVVERLSEPTFGMDSILKEAWKLL